MKKNLFGDWGLGIEILKLFNYIKNGINLINESKNKF